MGCSSSKPTRGAAEGMGDTPDKASTGEGGKSLEAQLREKVSRPGQRPQLVQRKDVELLDEKKALHIFNSYKQERTTAANGSASNETESPNGSAGKPRGFSSGDAGTKNFLNYADMKAMMTGVPDELFHFVFRLFDADGSGHVNADEFVMTLALLARHCNTVEEQVEACFTMFDVDGTGSLSHEEFSNMIMATVNLNLGFLLNTQAGEAAFDSQLDKEYSDENLDFWQAATKFRTEFPADDDDVALTLAQSIINMHVRDGSDRQVNLPAKVQKQILQEVATAVTGGNKIKRTIFEAAAQEIFTLMERDTYKRFRSDKEAVSTLVDNFFKEADIQKDGLVHFEEYKKWAMGNKEVLSFMNMLTTSAKGLINHVRTQSVADIRAQSEALQRDTAAMASPKGTPKGTPRAVKADVKQVVQKV